MVKEPVMGLHCGASSLGLTVAAAKYRLFVLLVPLASRAYLKRNPSTFHKI